MKKYKRKPALVEAVQWFRNGDHPMDGSEPVNTTGHSTTLTEGKVVKFFRRLNIPGDRVCQECGTIMHKHGLIESPNDPDGEIVHPGDYIVTDTKGRFYRRGQAEFEALFEEYDPEKEGENPKIDLRELADRVTALEEIHIGSHMPDPLPGPEVPE